MEIFGILVLFTAKQGITRKSYEGIPLRTADKVYLVFLCLGYLLCMAAIVLSFPEYAISTPRILVVSAGMAFAICVVDLLSDLIGLGMGAKEAGRGTDGHRLSHGNSPSGDLSDRPAAGSVLARQYLHRHDHRARCVCRQYRAGRPADLRKGFPAEETGLSRQGWGSPLRGAPALFCPKYKKCEVHII